MIHRIVTLITALALSLCLAVPASAAEGTISVHLDAGELPVTEGAFTLYRVGVRVSEGYRITEDFGGGFVREQDALSPHLAQWLAEAKGEQGRQLLLDVEGNAVFSQLGEGLYLLVQTELTEGFYPIQPFLLEIPSGTRWEYPVNLEPLPRVAPSPETGQGGLLYLAVAAMTASAALLLLCWKKRPMY